MDAFVCSDGSNDILHCYLHAIKRSMHSCVCMQLLRFVLHAPSVLMHETLAEATHVYSICANRMTDLFKSAFAMSVSFLQSVVALTQGL